MVSRGSTCRVQGQMQLALQEDKRFNKLKTGTSEPRTAEDRERRGGEQERERESGRE